ncbi:MAG: hypothetical protein WDM94_12940 [Bauldia sp.]
MVATRRPQLVELTLRSFHLNLLRRLRAPRLIINIDPAWGSEEDDREVERICRQYFEVVDIRRPEVPGFGAAVRWTWSEVATEWFLHLEDDWLLAWRINPDHLATQLNDLRVGQVQLSNASRRRRWRLTPHVIATSPGFIRRTFAEIAVDHMDPALDPEKQFYQGHNPVGAAALSAYRTRFYGGPFTPQLMRDTGRMWRKVRGLRKRVVEGASIWVDADRKKPMSAYSANMDRMERRLNWSRLLPEV